jgi:competence protein ComEA
LEFTREHKLALAVLAGICLTGLAQSLSKRGSGQGDVVLYEPGVGRARISSSLSDRMPYPSRYAGKVVFHVVGCVNKPGVYALSEGERVIDAIREAGGPTANADLNALNLAAKIDDGSRIEVPAKSDSRLIAAPVQVFSTNGTAFPANNLRHYGGKLQSPGSGTVSLNSADEAELQRLPGVGPATARKIVEYRHQIRRFTSVEQLMDVKGIGPKKLDKMREFLTL